MDNKIRVQQFQDDLARHFAGEAVDFTAHFTEQTKWHLPQSTASPLLQGRNAVIAMFEQGVSSYYQPDTMRFEHLHRIAEDDLVHSHFSLTAKTATGQHYHNHYQSLFRLEEGLIAEVWEYFDTAYLNAVFSGG